MKKILLSLSEIMLAIAPALAASGDTFKDNGVTYEVTSEEPMTVKVSGFTDELPAEVTLPAEINGYSVTAIGQGAFYSCTVLTSVEISDNVTLIDWLAFFGCSNLTDVNIPNSVTTIFRDSFYNCSSLTSVEVPGSVTSIGNQAFYGCTSLQNLTLSDGDSPLSFGDNALKKAPIESLYLGRSFSGTPFKGLESLNNLTISNSVTSLPDNAFEQCVGITSIEIPASVASLGTYVFSDCINLASITCLATVPPTASSPTFNGFNKSECTLTVPRGCAETYESTIYWDGFKAYLEPGFQINDIFIDNGVEYDVISVEPKMARVIGYTDDIPAVLIIPTEVNGCSVTEIYRDCFNECTRLTSIEIPSTVSAIQRNTFKDCENLSSITLPVSLTSIDGQAFMRCCNLTSITCLATVPPNAKGVTFTGFDKSKCTLIVPNGSVEAYKVAANWDGFKEYEPIVAVGDTFTVDGVTYKVTSNDPKTVEIRGFTDEIAADVILREAVNGYSLNSIGYGAFEECNNLASVVIPSSVTSIGTNAFSGCNDLKSITLPTGLNSLGEKAFAENSNLITVIYLTDEPVDGADNLFTDYATPTLYALLSEKEKYESIEPWNQFENTAWCGVHLNTTELDLMIGQTAQLSANIVLPPGEMATDVVWSSSAPNIAEVDNDGKVRAMHYGAATLSAIAGPYQNDCEVTVYDFTTNNDEIFSEENKTVDIFNLQGVCLKRNASVKDVLSLTPGFYIIGDQKILIRK